VSAQHVKYALATAVLIALIGLAVARIAATAAHMTKLRVAPGAIATTTAMRFERDPSAGGSILLAENSYDFENPDSIPGFGTLPPDYDSGPVMPRMASE